MLPWRLVIKVRCLALQSRMVTASTTNQNSNSSMVTLKSGEQIPRTCSFVETGEGFTEQHWYNCYTCGLLWDKVCSSSIALRRLLFISCILNYPFFYIFVRDVVRYVPEFAIRVTTLDIHVNRRSSVTVVLKWQLLLPKDEHHASALQPVAEDEKSP